MTTGLRLTSFFIRLVYFGHAKNANKRPEDVWDESLLVAPLSYTGAHVQSCASGMSASSINIRPSWYTRF